MATGTIPTSAPSPRTGQRGKLALAFERRGGRSVLAERYACAPFGNIRAAYPDGRSTGQAGATADKGGRYMIHCHNLAHEDHDLDELLALSSPIYRLELVMVGRLVAHKRAERILPIAERLRGSGAGPRIGPATQPAAARKARVAP